MDSQSKHEDCSCEDPTLSSWSRGLWRAEMKTAGDECVHSLREL